MLNKKKIVIVTPAGRKRYMEILLKYILREKDIIDEYRIWVNTKNQEDLDYFNELKEKYPDFITLDERFKEEHDCGSNINIFRFFDKCTEENTVYIRLDDDIVWLESNFIKKLAEFRIKNPKPFLIYGAILNNAVIDSIVQKLGLYSNLPPIGYNCLDENGWRSPEVAVEKHNYLIDNYLSKLKTPPKLFDNWMLNNYERVSINCISWLGEEFAKFEGKVDHDEESWLSVVRPDTTKNPNMIYGGVYCVHYAFYTQREHVNKMNILKQYQKFSTYLDVDVKSIEFSKIKWDNVSDISKILISQILKEEENQ